MLVCLSQLLRSTSIKVLETGRNPRLASSSRPVWDLPVRWTKSGECSLVKEKKKSHRGNLDSNTHARISPEVFLAIAHAALSLANRQDGNRERRKRQQNELFPMGKS